MTPTQPTLLAIVSLTFAMLLAAASAEAQDHSRSTRTTTSPAPAPNLPSAKRKSPEATQSVLPAGKSDTSQTATREGAEVSMIELQSAIAKRAAALQLATGVQRSLNEGPKSVAKNIGGNGPAGSPSCKTCVRDSARK